MPGLQAQSEEKGLTSAYNNYCLDPYTDYVAEMREKYLALNENAYSGVDYKGDALTSEEMSISMEIAYFRDKAEYYRRQKVIVAMHAQKLKRELELMLL